MQYSKHQELKMQQVRPLQQAFDQIFHKITYIFQSTSQSVGTAAATLIPPSLSGGASPSGGAAYVLDPASPQPQPGVPHSVLRVIIENMLYPITIDVLHQVHVKYFLLNFVHTLYMCIALHVVLHVNIVCLWCFFFTGLSLEYIYIIICDL